MYLHDGRVQLDGFDPDAHDLLPLQLFKDAVQCAILRPAVHASIDGVPIAEALGQPTPLASLLGHIQNRVQHRQVRHADIATLTRQTGLYAKVLRLCDLHKHRITRKYQLVLTRPRCPAVIPAFYLFWAVSICAAVLRGASVLWPEAWASFFY